jgi:ATP adenylyltransferase
MKTLWTPWRLDHVTGKFPRAGNCIFEPQTDLRYDKSELLLLKTRDTVVLLNRFPYANGHLLVAPARHVPCITGLTFAENAQLTAVIKECVIILKKHLNPDGLNVGCNIGATAGAGIADHLHYHIVPRWEGDHNFMAVLSEIRTIPEHIEATFDRLLPDFIRISEKYT